MTESSPPPDLTPQESQLPARESSSRVGRMFRLTLKECRETLRDRRTILTLILMPVLVYPLLSIGFQKFLLSESTKQKPNEIQIGVRNPQEFEIIREVLNEGERNFPPTRSGSDAPLRPEKPPAIVRFFDESRTHVSLDEAVRHGHVDLGIRIRRRNPPALEIDRDVHMDWEIIAVKGSVLSEQALAYVERRLESANQKLLEHRLRYLGVTQRPSPVESRLKILDPGESLSAGGQTFSSLIPVVLILMTMTGGVYPAIDLTAGERERGTLEMLIAAPVSRYELLFAKFVAVVLVSMLTAVVNLVSMAVTLSATGLGSVLWGDRGLSLLVIVQILFLLLLFASFFAAVLLSLTSFARSFKEAQAYLIPLMMFSLSPGFVSLLPGMQLQGWLLIVPLLNMSLLTRDLLQGTAVLENALVVVLFTGFSAFAALSLAARLFGSAGVLYASDSGWGDFWRRPPTASTAPSLSGAMLTLAAIFPLQFVCVNFLAQARAWPLSTRLMLMGMCSLALFVGITWLSAYWGNVRPRETFRWSRPRFANLVGGALLGLAMWPFAIELTLIMQSLGLVSVRPEHFSSVKQLLESAQGIPLGVWWLSFAIIPAVSEEFFFRGFLQSALLSRMRPGLAICCSSVVFGAFHLVAQEGLAFERFLPSALLGGVLGWLCYRSGSLIPGMVTHLVHNGLLMTLAYYEKPLQAAGWGAQTGDHLPLSWLAVASVGVGIAGLVLRTVPPHGATLDTASPSPTA